MPGPSPHASQVDLTSELEEARARETHPCRKIAPAELLSWPVRELCDPIGHYPPVLFNLPDGTSVYLKDEKECFRGRRSPNCFKKCLPGWARIDTPDGPRRVDELREGSIVWSVADDGIRFAAPLVRVGSVAVGDRHPLLRILLSDGRVVEGSWHHPTATGGVIGELQPGSLLDGSAVLEIRELRYSGRRTFDILPAGPTGFYFAERVLLGSSLRED